MRWIFPGSWYVDALLVVSGGRDPVTGVQQPDELVELPRALLAPGASSEEALLSDVATGNGRLFFEDAVDVSPDDRIEVDGPFGTQRWQVEGFPRFWPLGCEVVASRVS